MVEESLIHKQNILFHRKCLSGWQTYVFNRVMWETVDNFERIPYFG